MADRLLSEAEVVARFTDRLRREPGFTAAQPGRKGPLDVEIQAEGLPQAFGISLDSLYRFYVASPTKLDEAMEALVDQLRQLPGQLKAQSQGTDTEAILPQIKNREFLDTAQSQGTRLANRLLVDDLFVVYVADTPTAMRFLSESDLERNGWTVEELHELALGNLEIKAAGTPFVFGGEGDRSLIISQTNDSYDAARILIPSLRDEIAAHLAGRMLFAVPNRDFLVTLGDADPDFVREIAGIVSNDYEGRPHPLSPHLYQVDGDTFTRYAP